MDVRSMMARAGSAQRDRALTRFTERSGVVVMDSVRKRPRYAWLGLWAADDREDALDLIGFRASDLDSGVLDQACFVCTERLREESPYAGVFTLFGNVELPAWPPLAAFFRRQVVDPDDPTRDAPKNLCNDGSAYDVNHTACLLVNTFIASISENSRVQVCSAEQSLARDRLRFARLQPPVMFWSLLAADFSDPDNRLPADQILRRVLRYRTDLRLRVSLQGTHDWATWDLDSLASHVAWRDSDSPTPPGMSTSFYEARAVVLEGVAARGRRRNDPGQRPQFSPPLPFIEVASVPWADIFTWHEVWLMLQNPGDGLVALARANYGPMMMSRNVPVDPNVIDGLQHINDERMWRVLVVKTFPKVYHLPAYVENWRAFASLIMTTIVNMGFTTVGEARQNRRGVRRYAIDRLGDWESFQSAASAESTLTLRQILLTHTNEQEFVRGERGATLENADGMATDYWSPGTIVNAIVHGPFNERVITNSTDRYTYSNFQVREAPTDTVGGMQGITVSRILDDRTETVEEMPDYMRNSDEWVGGGETPGWEYHEMLTRVITYDVVHFTFTLSPSIFISDRLFALGGELSNAIREHDLGGGYPEQPHS